MYTPFTLSNKKHKHIRKRNAKKCHTSKHGLAVLELLQKEDQFQVSLFLA
jgi:hypothetical protein